MVLYSESQKYKLYQGSMRYMTDIISDNSIDAIVTDPPYELNFMNKGWDHSGIAFEKETWEKCFKVLKPGGYLLAFGGSRTFHRIACAIEDAGFEIRDTIMWLYGAGFPKSMNIGLAIDKKKGVESIDTGEKINSMTSLGVMHDDNWKSQKDITRKKAQNEWNGWGTALKPSYEPIVVARKPCEGSCIDNVLKYGVGGINIDGCRVEPTGEDIGRNNHVKSYGGITINESNTPPKDGRGNFNGRFPANTILTYDETDFDEVCGGMPTKNTPNGSKKNPNLKNSLGNGGIYGYYSENQPLWDAYNDSGSAARYFYCAKASKRDRDEGLEKFEEKKCSMMASNANINKNGDFTGMLTGRETKRKNTHPTVKPTSLMQYLIRLVTPKGGTVLDPFNGSGSTGKAVMYENKDHNADYKYIGIELSREYLDISKARIDYVSDEEPETEDVTQISIFDFIEK